MKLTRLHGGLAAVALLLAAHAAARGQENRPAVEFQSLLNLRYYEADGGFLADSLQLVFPPQGQRSATFVVTKVGGGEVASVPLRIERLSDFTAFGALFPDGNPGVVRIKQSGDFVLTVKVGGETVSALPFSLKEEKSADPFNPKQTFRREGPWREWAYLSARVDEPNAHVFFNWWMSLRELPAGTQRPLCTIHLMQGAQEVAASNSAIVPSYDDWQFFSREMVLAKVAGQRQQQYLTKAALAGRDGEYSVVVKANGQPVKSYRLQVKGGQIQAAERSRLGYEPRTDFISPRLIDTSAGSTSRYQMLEAYWLRKSAK